jgi:hypothetical protein
MSDDQNPESFEARMRAFAEEVSRSVERLSDLDQDDIARAIGVDPQDARKWFDGATGWLRAQAGAVRPPSGPSPASPAPARGEDPLRGAGPSPLDVPTAEQGLALAALDSGRWTLEPGTSALTAHGEGPGPSDALGLVRELRVHDWVSADGKLTLAGERALARWLDAAER